MKNKKCPMCGQKIWKTDEIVFNFKSEKEGNLYQAVGTVYWCPDGSMEPGCGFTKVELDD